MSKFTVKELKNMLDERSVKYNSKMVKEDLLKMLDEYEMAKSVLIPQVHIKVTERSSDVTEQSPGEESQNVTERSSGVKPKKSRRQRKVEVEVERKVEVEPTFSIPEETSPKESQDVKPKKSTLWVETLKEYNKDKKYKIHNKESMEYKEILELYNKKKASNQL